MKRIIFIVIAIVGFGISFISTSIIFLYVSSHRDNDRILRQHITQLEKIQHPANTSLVASQSGVHHPPGNGQTCYYFVAEVRTFTGNKNNLELFYRDRPIRLVFIQGDRFPREVPYGFDKLDNWNLPAKIPNNNLYLIYILYADFENYHRNSFDIRCH